MLNFHDGKIHTPGINSRRRAGFQALYPERELPKTLCQRNRGWITRSTAAALLQTDVNFAAQKGASGEDNFLADNLQSHLSSHATDHPFGQQKIINSRLKD